MITIYRAFDGTEFDNEFDCRTYERECDGKLKRKFESLFTNYMCADEYLDRAGCDFCAEGEVACVFIENEECLKIVNDCLCRLYSTPIKDALTDDMIGKRVAFWRGDYADDGYCLGTREEMLANYNKALDVLFGKE